MKSGIHTCKVRKYIRADIDFLIEKKVSLFAGNVQQAACPREIREKSAIISEVCFIVTFEPR
ncbi:hypothetical protein GCM10010918_33510 [Paenibacillus radicis (ex Gao et al. 2016)]|uniref:Uncharacterized protein n=1 Tax=Paenibacillus radicis (ex Gao et al. 2016) TaxID=1737354 RepID=A0A917M3M0_9BACL|nr:hypothetical protein GCM10010918_33510 [Paenibacillus radicis (ex Gao et al. 2016)]